jgi:hypothetical protein
MAFHFPPRSYLMGILSNGVILRIFTASDTIPFGIWLCHSCTHQIEDIILCKVLIISGEIRMFLITLGLQPCVDKESNSYFDFVALIDDFQFSCLDLIPIHPEGNVLIQIYPDPKLLGT